MNPMVIISSMSLEGELSLWQQIMHELSSTPFWVTLSLLMIPVSLILLRWKPTTRTVVLVIIGLFLSALTLCQLIPGATLNIIGSKEAWQDSPQSTAFLALIGTVVAPLAFFLIALFLVRRAKNWMQQDK